MRNRTKKNLRAILAFALSLAIGVAFMPLGAGEVHAASFSTSGSVSNLAVTAFDATSVTLSWSAYDGATGYQVYKATTQSGSYSLIKTTSSTSWKRTGLTTNKTCYYKVRAYYKGSSTTYSKYSAAVAGTPQTFATGSAVSGLKIDSVNDSTISLKWNAFSLATGYEVYKATTKDGNYELIKTLSDTSWQRGDLTTNKTCYYKVRAYRKTSSGTSYSKYSTAVAGTAEGFGTTGKVEGLKVSATTYNSATLAWNAYPLATGYQVYKATKKDGNYSLIKTTSDTSWKRTSLTTNKTCYYKVRAYYVKTNGSKLYSKFNSAVSATPKLDTPSVTASSSASGINVTWGKITGASGYVLYRATSKDGNYTTLKTLTGTSFNNTSLTKDKSYYYKVRAYRTVSGSKKYSSYSSAALGMKTSVAQVKGLNASSEDTAIKLSWNSVSGASGYEISRASGSASNYSVVGTASTTSFSDKNVANGVTYYYRVRAYKTVSNSKIYGSYSAKGYSREAVVSTAVGWLGCKESNKTNKPIVDLYNKNMGTNFSYTTAWCAMFVSAVAIKSGTTSIIVRGSYCPTVLNTYKNSKVSNYSYGKGKNYVPKPGDVIFFDWQPNGTPDHTGLVATVNGNTIKTIEGNYSDAVGYRTFNVGYSYVQGYGLPNYDNANGIVFTGRSTASVGCGELEAVGISSVPEGYDALGSEYDFVEQKVEDNVGCGGDVSDYDKMAYMVKKVRQNAEAEDADCSTSQYYAAFIYKLCQEAGLEPSIVTAEDADGNVSAWIEVPLEGKWYRVDASKAENQITEFVPDTTDTK